MFVCLSWQCGLQTNFPVLNILGLSIRQALFKILESLKVVKSQHGVKDLYFDVFF